MSRSKPSQVQDAGNMVVQLRVGVRAASDQVGPLRASLHQQLLDAPDRSVDPLGVNTQIPISMARACSRATAPGEAANCPEALQADARIDLDIVRVRMAPARMASPSVRQTRA